MISQTNQYLPADSLPGFWNSNTTVLVRSRAGHPAIDELWMSAHPLLRMVTLILSRADGVPPFTLVAENFTLSLVMAAASVRVKLCAIVLPCDLPRPKLPVPPVVMGINSFGHGVGVVVVVVVGMVVVTLAALQTILLEPSILPLSWVLKDHFPLVLEDENKTEHPLGKDSVCASSKAAAVGSKTVLALTHSVFVVNMVSALHKD